MTDNANRAAAHDLVRVWVEMCALPQPESLGRQCRFSQGGNDPSCLWSMSVG